MIKNNFKIQYIKHLLVGNVQRLIEKKSQTLYGSKTSLLNSELKEKEKRQYVHCSRKQFTSDVPTCQLGVNRSGKATEVMGSR